MASSSEGGSSQIAKKTAEPPAVKAWARVRRSRLSGDRIGQLAEETMRKLDDALALIFEFWDTHRVLVAVLIMGVFVLLTAVAARVVLAKLRAQRSLFATTLAELAKDRAALRAPP